MRTGSVSFNNSEYEGSTLTSIERYFSTFEEPFIKGLLKDKGGKILLLRIEIKQNDILFLMQQLMNEFKQTFLGMPLYLYVKQEKRKSEPNRCKAFTLLWRVSRSVCGTGDNTMITQLFSDDSKHEYLLKKFGPGMREKLREYDECRLSLNMAENLLRYQKRSIRNFSHATSLDS